MCFPETILPRTSARQRGSVARPPPRNANRALESGQVWAAVEEVVGRAFASSFGGHSLKLSKNPRVRSAVFRTGRERVMKQPCAKGPRRLTAVAGEVHC